MSGNNYAKVEVDINVLTISIIGYILFGAKLKRPSVKLTTFFLLNNPKS